MADDFIVREARLDELPLTERIESEADTLLIEHLAAVDWPPSTTPAERAALPGFVLVVENVSETGSAEVVGFVHVLEIDGHAHLEQLSVLPRYGRGGRGRMLVEAAKDEARRRGHTVMTLRTYRDVAWNAPFYARCGFIESTPDSALLRGLVDVEAALGLDLYGARVQMSTLL